MFLCVYSTIHGPWDEAAINKLLVHPATTLHSQNLASTLPLLFLKAILSYRKR